MTFNASDYDIIRMVTGNGQSEGFGDPGNGERTYLVVDVSGGPGIGAPRWTWNTQAGGGDDIIDLRGGTGGLIWSGPGADTFLISSETFGRLWLPDFDITQDRIIFDDRGGDFRFDSFSIPTEGKLTEIVREGNSFPNLSLSLDYSYSELVAAGAFIEDTIVTPEIPDGLAYIGIDLSSDPVPDLTSFGAGGNVMGDTNDVVSLGSDTENVTGSLGFGSDVLLVSGGLGGDFGLGGTASRWPSSVVTSGGQRIVIVEGSRGAPDGDPDTVIFTPFAAGDWRISHIDASDRLVLWGFEDISSFADLQLRAFGGDYGETRYQLTDSLSLLTAFEAEDITVLSGLVATGNGFIEGGSFDDFLRGGDGSDMLIGRAGHDRMEAGDGNDTVNGGAGNDLLLGGRTTADLRDVIFGGAGDDSIDGGHGNDELMGQDGNDTMEGGFGVDTVIGGTGDDAITGSAFSDLIFGGDGSDFVNGGFGFDRVNGGAGADRFFHIGIAGHASDWIQDYDATESDVLVYGGAGTAADFQVNFANTDRAGSDAVAEAFVIFRPTGQILWALIDGAGQDEIILRVGGSDFDLLT